MKIQIFRKKTQAQTGAMKTMTKNNKMISEIEELKKEDRASVWGGPQVRNDPQPN
jgi:hypothetical protein